MDQHRSQTLLQYTFPLHLSLFPNTHNLLSLQILAFWVRDRVVQPPPPIGTGAQRGSGLFSTLRLPTAQHSARHRQSTPVRETWGCARGGLPCRVRDPLVPAGQCGRGGETLGKPVPTARVRWPQATSWLCSTEVSQRAGQTVCSRDGGQTEHED